MPLRPARREKKNKEESGLGRGWAGKRREEAGLNSLLGLKSRRIKEINFN
jgi:hypothetical protein